VSLKVIGEQSNGLATVLEGVVHSGGPPVHVHEMEDEIVIVLDGELGYQVGEERAAGGEPGRRGAAIRRRDADPVGAPGRVNRGEPPGARMPEVGAVSSCRHSWGRPSQGNPARTTGTRCIRSYR
jgi:hypothetical protein